jgi:DNA-directed RNA polymerase subunit RPC12/RpoP
MALITCPECGSEVSDQAKACPKCGHPIAVAARMPSPQEAHEDRAVDVQNPQRSWAWALTAGGIAMVVGSVLPWRTATLPLVGTVNVAGTEGDGVITLVVGLLVALFGGLSVARGMGLGRIILVLVLVAGAALVTVSAYVSATDVVAEINDDGVGRASVGIGLHLVALGVATGFFGGFGLLQTRQN